MCECRRGCREKLGGNVIRGHSCTNGSMRNFCLLNGTDFAGMPPPPFPVEIGYFSIPNKRDKPPQQHKRTTAASSQLQPHPSPAAEHQQLRPLAGSEGSCSLGLDFCRPSDWCKGQRVKGNLFKVKSPTDGLEIRTPQSVSLAAVRNSA